MRVLVNNPRAQYDYYLLTGYCAGLVLKGSEVKSLALGQGSLKEAYVFIDKHEVYIKDFSISPYAFSGEFNHPFKRVKKLLLNRNEIKQITARQKQEGLSIIPLKVFFKNGKIKMEIWLAKPKKKFDKREAIKSKTIQRELRQQYGSP
ncbi:SsrA-binding protein [Mycoplasmoides pneumoniae]|uniref:SsrA-binding protein n=3 Tax=Mycoplasmoides pneumoniae TaxID=2104 RepID=SSRP_MYCPN|nr:SsrA-binding protein [Mycoplasmoides pneumoniae]P75043.1 RecName: Full=SsrA-binding protein; AltName: Full=Small protein B [Mycoplasmoides pneumoniae M129]AAB95729.1 hypothetical protein MPN_074 [Mycoplasmoides pneumoniae M129]AGC04015.1 single-stranded DNA-binding protein [Mycoplasmoides pneumoniae M129-B7]ALA29952.1 single-stranded DNA-binding protein [Mycoplasmoides pneumoniae PI 1428]ALA30921.1 single-stranded DNA-binding protein [Mycoplasmoides pneumoniae 19294]ALA31357.1 single-stran